MGKCERIRSPRRKLCAGDMRHMIEIQTRRQQPTRPGQTEIPQAFVTIRRPKAMIKTVEARSGGTARFLGVNIETAATHLFIVRRAASMAIEETGNNFVLFNERRFRILRVNITDEDPYAEMIQCTERGDNDKAATTA